MAELHLTKCLLHEEPKRDPAVLSFNQGLQNCVLCGLGINDCMQHLKCNQRPFYSTHHTNFEDDSHVDLTRVERWQLDNRFQYYACNILQPCCTTTAFLLVSVSPALPAYQHICMMHKEQTIRLQSHLHGIKMSTQACSLS